MGREFLASPISPRRVSLLHSPAWRSEVQQLAGDGMGFTWIHPGDHRGPFWFKKRTQLMENDEQMMKTHGH